MRTPRTPLALVLRAAGTNCDRETVRALELAGARVEPIHVNRLSAEPRRLEGADLLAIPGGFTFGDDVASGAVLAHILERRLRPALDRFIAEGKLLIGICNGFQILVRLGILPGIPAGASAAGRAALLPNHSGRFEDRWVRLRAGTRSTPWTEAGSELLVPVAHAEGRFAWFPDRDGTPFPPQQIAFRYLGEGAGTARYPENPNGSFEGIAGITNAAGNVLGLMPHPERFIVPEHHPSWMRYRREDGSPPEEDELPVPLGVSLYRRAVASIDGRG